MEFYFIYDSRAGLYYIQNNEPFFFAFTKQVDAERFCNGHAGTRLMVHSIESEEEDDYLTECLYQQGYKGGYIDGSFCPLNQNNPELCGIIPENNGLLNLILYQGTKKKRFIENQRFYFFATVTDEGLLAFANTEGYILGFTDIDHMDTKLAKQLYQLGYEVIRYYMDEEHKYLINVNKASQCRIEQAFELKSA